MQVTVNLQDLLILVLLVVAIVLLIYLVVVAAKLIGTIKKVNEVLDDTKRISTVAADKTEAVSGVIDEASMAVMNLADTVRGNSSFIDKAKDIGLGVVSLKNVADAVRSSEEESYVKRRDERKAKSKRKK